MIPLLVARKATAARKQQDIEDQTSVPKDSPKAAPESDPTFQGRCRELLLNVLRLENSRASIIALEGDDAQHMADFLDITLHDYKTYLGTRGTYRSVSDLLYRIATKAHVMPCYHNLATHPRVRQVEGIQIRVVHTSNQDGTALLRARITDFIAWAHLTHENLLPFYGVFVEGAQLYLVPGRGDLRGHLRGMLDASERTFLASDVLRGLQYLHQQSIIHGNLETETIMVSNDGCALLGDFGVVPIERASGLNITQPDGTSARWSAPELIDSDNKGNKILPTRKSDIWSFGCVCYEIFTGKPPFGKYQREFDVVRALVVRKEIPGPLDKDGGGPKWVWTMLRKCWDNKPLARPECEDIDSNFFSGGRHRPSRPFKEDLQFWERTKKWNSPIDYLRIWSILLRTLGGSADNIRLSLLSRYLLDYQDLHANVDKCYKSIYAIGREKWSKFMEMLSSDDAQGLADHLDLVVHNGQEHPKSSGKDSLLSRLAILVAKTQAFPELHDLTRLNIAFEHVTSNVHRGEYLGHKLCARLIPDFDQTNDPKAWLNEHMKDLMTWTHLCHPNILPLYGLYCHSGQNFLVFPWITGGNLRNYLQQSPDASRMHLVAEILAGLHYLHEQGIVHANLKATSVFISATGHALLADYGAPYIVRAEGVEVVPAMYRWTAPELLQTDEGALHTRESDIWSFGCLCYEVFTRRVPFYQYKQDYKVFSILTTENVTPLREDPEDGSHGITDSMWEMMEACWNRNPFDRPHCEDLQEEYFQQFGVYREESELPVAAFWDAIKFSRGIQDRIEFKNIDIFLDRIQTDLHSLAHYKDPGLYSGSDHGREGVRPESTITGLNRHVSECRKLLLDAKGHKARVSFIVRQKGRDAQETVDFLEDMLHNEGWAPSDDDWGFILSCLTDLASGAIVIPRCHELDNTEFPMEYAVDVMGNSDIYMTNPGARKLGIKTVSGSSVEHVMANIVELTIQTHLSHPNILPLYGAFRAEPQIGLVFPWMEKGSLLQYIRNLEGTRGSARIHLISDILDGLQYLHENNIVHGGIRAENCLVSNEGRVLIADFTTCRVAGTGWRGTNVKLFQGAIRWTAPELIAVDTDDEENQAILPACDIWSFGCVCAEILTGKVPFSRHRLESTIMYAILKGQMPWQQEDFEDKHYNISQGMIDMMKDCWSREPSTRPQCEKIRSRLSSEYTLPFPVEGQAILESEMVRDDGAFLRREKWWSVDYERVHEILRQAHSIP